MLALGNNDALHEVEVGTLAVQRRIFRGIGHAAFNHTPARGLDVPFDEGWTDLSKPQQVPFVGAPQEGFGKLPSDPGG